MGLMLYFLRHGQTAASRDNVYCGGDFNAPLTDDGRAMAQGFARAYHKAAWQAVYVSPLQRARDTLQPLAEAAGLEPQVREELREIRYGAWDGKTVEEASGAHPAEHKRWLADPAWHPPTGGETAFDVAGRALSLVRQVARQFDAGQVLFVSHKATIRATLAALLGLDLGHYRHRLGCPVASLSVVELAGHGPLLHRLGDTEHLEPRLRALTGT